MANPQVEDGYTRIANKLLEAITIARLPVDQMAIVHFIIRMSYGFSKKEADLTLDDFARGTGILKPNASRAIMALLSKMIIIREKKSKTISTYRINKDYEQWALLSNPTIIKSENYQIRQRNVIKSDNNDDLHQYIKENKRNSSQLNCDDTQKTENDKPPKPKKPPKTYTENEASYRLSMKLLDLILKRNPEHKKPNLHRWADHIEKMIRIDNRNPEKISRIITWCQQDEFWQNNILSTKKLREHFDTLVLRAKTNGGEDAEPTKYWRAPRQGAASRFGS